MRSTFSHKLATSVISLYIVVVCIVAVTWMITDRDGSFLIEALNLPVMAIITGYLAKSGVENLKKIETRKEEKDDTHT